MQMRLTKTNAHVFDKLADLTTQVLVECSQLLEKLRIDLNL